SYLTESSLADTLQHITCTRPERVHMSGKEENVKRRVFLAAMTAMVLVLAACGESGGASESTTTTQATDDGGDEALKIAILLDGETSDRGFNATGEQAVEMLKEKYGADATYTESVNVAQSADIFRQYAQQGYD